MKILLTSTMALAVLSINQPVKADPASNPNIHLVRGVGGGHGVNREAESHIEEAGREEAAAREKENIDKKENSTEAEAAQQRNTAERNTAESTNQSHTRTLGTTTETNKKTENNNLQKYNDWTGVDGGLGTVCATGIDGNCIPNQQEN